jgi:hypothetical protein
LMSEPAQGAIEMELGNYARNRPVNGMPVRGRDPWRNLD